jgi:hypothetical protein
VKLCKHSYLSSKLTSFIDQMRSVSQDEVIDNLPESTTSKKHGCSCR